MIDKIIVKIRRYPFQTGIVIGVLISLLCVGFISLFQDHGRTLSGNSEIIQQDYLRMSIHEFSENNDEQLAGWRFQHLGNKSVQTLKLMQSDETIPVQDLVSFAKAIGQEDKLGDGTVKQQSEDVGTPSNPRKGLSTFGKVLLIILGLAIAAAGILYLISLFKTKNKQKKRSDVKPLTEDEPINMITPEKARSVQNDTPDTLFDLDSLFPQNESADDSRDEKESEDEDEDNEEREEEVPSEKQETDDENTENVNSENDQTEGVEAADNENEKSVREEKIEEKEPDDIQQFINDHKDLFSNSDNNSESAENVENETVIKTEDKTEDKTEEEPKEESEEKLSDSHQEPDHDDSSNNIDNASADLNSANTANENEGTAENGEQKRLFDDLPQTEEKTIEAEKQSDNEAVDNTAEKPLIETDNESESEDELLKIIRGSTANQNETPAAPVPDVQESQMPENTEQDYNEKSIGVESEPENEAASEDGILIHYQSVYRIGNDMYDEVFSIDQGDVFRGECGIGIGETLNNTEPKAVTAFEVWLFDKDDIHTATWYLMSDFALSNEGISSRLSQRGKCDRIRKNDLYVLETETLQVEIKVLDLEYGNEMEEKNSYFTNVAFDVIAREKPVDRTSAD